MPESNHLGLPFLEAGQAQKHVTHNEALRILDALVQLSVTAISSSPPGSPAEGERHIVAESASGAFASKDNKIAIYEDGAWRFLTPRAGWRAWNEEEERLLLWSGSAWTVLDSGSEFDPDDVGHLYLNDAAPGDANVKFAMRGESALLHAIPVADSGTGDVRLQISKESAGDTASVFFANNFSGRAEFGLSGSDNFKLKVSADGTSWTEALDIDRATGRVRLPPALALADADQLVARRHIRELLTANHSYYVRADGSDSNNGLANNSGGAFLTLQKAMDVAGSLDTSIYDVEVHVAAGTYDSFDLKSTVGTGKIVFTGDTTTPANVVISTTAAGDHCIDTAGVNGRFLIRGFKITASGAGSVGLYIVGGPGLTFQYGNMEFGACASRQVLLSAGVFGKVTGPIRITGSSSQHIFVADTAYLDTSSIAYTLAGTLVFSQFILAQTLGTAWCGSASFNTSGASITAARYSALLNGLVLTGGGGASFFPGSSAGSTSSGGQYA
jgi:hypothetical protein